MLLTTYDSHGYQPAGQFERGGDGLLEARGDARLDEQAVDDHFDGVVLALVDDREIVEREQLTVDAHADVAVLCEFFELLAKSALTAADDGRKDHDAVVGLADFTVQDGLHDLLAGLAGGGRNAVWAMRGAPNGVDHPEGGGKIRECGAGGARGAR